MLAAPARNENRDENGKSSRNRPKSGNLSPLVKTMATTTTTSSYQVHAEARGPHWISWISRGADNTPHRSVVLIGANQKEAEERARQWAERQTD